MLDPRFELKEALYDRIKANTSYRVNSGWKRNQPYPYIYIGESISVDASVKSEPSNSIIVSIHCFDDQSTDKRISDMLNDIQTGVTFTNDASPSLLTLTNYNVIRQDYDGARDFQEYDNDKIKEIRHSILDIKFLLQEK
jgi:hypothetical protein